MLDHACWRYHAFEGGSIPDSVAARNQSLLIGLIPALQATGGVVCSFEAPLVMLQSHGLVGLRQES